MIRPGMVEAGVRGRRWRLRFGWAGALLAFALLAGSVLGAAQASAYSARGSVEQVYVTGLNPGVKVDLLNHRGRVKDSGRANELGGLLFREVRPGSGYRVRPAPSGPASSPLTVLSKRSAPPSASVYNQSIPSSGYSYLTTRDGTKLAISVRPSAEAAAGPTPVLIEYSGYGYADPAGPESGIAAVGNILGFTVVDVNIRGTGCSGGAFDFFEPLQGLDGYDVIETIARQPWAKYNKVGMMGVSYGGISQLFTAATRPPSLAAIAPLSVLDNTQTTLYPGGILNTGFAVPWAQDRIDDARPAGPITGQPWAYKRIQEGDTTCRDNQALHPEAVDLMQKIRENDTYKPAVADPLSPVTFVHKINVPTFLACQWQDEQTGGHCPTLARRMTGTQRKWFTFTNGTHIDSLAPETFNRWFDFLQLYVARQAPIVRSATVQAAGPVIMGVAMGIPGVPWPSDPIQQQPTYEGALAAFESLPSVRIRFDNGAGGARPGQPRQGFEHSFSRLPVPGTIARSWYLSEDGELLNTPSRRRAADQFTWNANARPLTNFSGNTGSGQGGLWTETPAYNWTQHPAGTALSYVTKPLASNTTVIGGGAVKVWVRSSRRNVDLQATVSEIRPDGKETFVQSGWVRGKARKLDRRKSTWLEPVLSLRQRHIRPLPSNRFVPVTIPLYYEGHAYRAGSRIRVVISAPRGDQPVWAFAETEPQGTAKVAIAFSKRKRSHLRLPVVPGVGVPTGLPPCPGLRAQPCRNYQPIANSPAR